MTEAAFNKLLKDYRLIPKLANFLSAERSLITVYDRKSATGFLSQFLPRLARVWLWVKKGDEDQLIEVEIPEGSTYSILPKYVEMECTFITHNKAVGTTIPAFFIVRNTATAEMFSLDIFNARGDRMDRVMVDLMQFMDSHQWGFA